MKKYHKIYCKKSISISVSRNFLKGNLYYCNVERVNTNAIWVFEDINRSDIGYRFYLKSKFHGIEYLFKDYFISERMAKLLKVNNKN